MISEMTVGGILDCARGVLVRIRPLSTSDNPGQRRAHLTGGLCRLTPSSRGSLSLSLIHLSVGGSVDSSGRPSVGGVSGDGRVAGGGCVGSPWLDCCWAS